MSWVIASSDVYLYWQILAQTLNKRLNIFFRAILSAWNLPCPGFEFSFLHSFNTQTVSRIVCVQKMHKKGYVSNIFWAYMTHTDFTLSKFHLLAYFNSSLEVLWIMIRMKQIDNLLRNYDIIEKYSNSCK